MAAGSFFVSFFPFLGRGFFFFPFGFLWGGFFLERIIVLVYERSKVQQVGNEN